MLPKSRKINLLIALINLGIPQLYEQYAATHLTAHAFPPELIIHISAAIDELLKGKGFSIEGITKNSPQNSASVLKNPYIRAFRYIDLVFQSKASSTGFEGAFALATTFTTWTCEREDLPKEIREAFFFHNFGLESMRRNRSWEQNEPKLANAVNAKDEYQTLREIVDPIFFVDEVVLSFLNRYTGRKSITHGIESTPTTDSVFLCGVCLDFYLAPRNYETTNCCPLCYEDLHETEEELADLDDGFELGYSGSPWE